jgi:hypothetical protein
MSKINRTIILFSAAGALLAGVGCMQAGIPFLSPTATPTLAPTSTATQTPLPTSTSLPTATPYPLAGCDDNGPYIATWATEQEGMSFEAYACADTTLVGIFHNQVFSDTITINQKEENDLEEAWKLGVDVDADSGTGTSNKVFDGIVGMDYDISLARWSDGKQETVPFKDAFQIDVWFCTKGCKVISEAEWYADMQSGLLILKGKIPGLYIDSKISFSRYYFELDNENSYKTDWLSATPVQ